MAGDIPSPALEDLAIFPLPSVVLFPGTVLPLHIFESRYREMTQDVLAGSRLLAVARLRPGFESDYHGRPPVFSTAGIGYVIASDELEDGRFNILVRGVGRVDITEELPPDRVYRRAFARRLIDSRSTRPEDVSVLHAELIKMCDRLAEHLPKGGDELRQLVRNEDAAGSCADVISAALVTDPDERQEILEMLDPADRVDRALDCVGQLLSRFGPAGEMLN